MSSKMEKQKKEEDRDLTDIQGEGITCSLS